MEVIKRDGRKANFNIEKIKRGIKDASNSLEKEFQISDEKLEKVLELIENKIKDKESIEAEDLLIIVQNALMNKNCYEVATEYIKYAEDRNKERFRKLEIMKEIKEKLDASNVQNQNANLDEHSFGGRKGEADSALLKKMALDYYISPKYAKNHINNRIYIHDLDSYVLGLHNCLSVPLDELLANGFKTRQVFIRPAGSVNTALQLIAVLFQLQSLQQFGGVAGTHVDWTLVPYIRKSFLKHFKDGLKYTERKPLFSTFDKVLTEIKKEDITKISIEDKKYKKYKKAYQYAMDMLKKEVYQGCEGLAHNLNSLQSRAGNQLPFSSINYGTCTEPEGRMFIKAMLDVTIKGVGNGQTSIFPCQIFQYKKGVNDKEGTPNYDLFKKAIECTSKRLYPNYVNCDWSSDQGYNSDDPRTYPSTMGCRTFSAFDINSPDGAHSHMKDGRGNIAPATIILPTLAMEAKKKAEHNQTEATDEFMKILDKAIDDCVGELVERFNWICAQNPASARFMYENKTFFSYGDEFEKEGIRGALKHGTLAVGQLGLAECLQILFGCDHTEKRGMDFAKKIEQLYFDKCADYKQKLRLNIGTYFSPSESLCYTAMKKFKAKYGVIPNISDHEYFTNSIHVPVWKEISPFEKIDIESQLTGYHRAGCITYVEIGDNAKNNLEGLEQIVKYAMDRDIPYFALNLPNCHCKSCGSDDVVDFDTPCPICGAASDQIERLARVTGYLSTDYRHFNAGKQAEVKDRFVHVNKLKDWKK